jgi:hypothetical protein
MQTVHHSRYTAVMLARIVIALVVGYLSVIWPMRAVHAEENSAQDEIRLLAAAKATYVQAKAGGQRALEHHLVLPYTGLNAVDRISVRRADDPLKTASLPVNPTDGAEHEAIFGTPQGELPRGTTSAQLHFAYGFLLLLLVSLVWQVRRRLNGTRG